MKGCDPEVFVVGGDGNIIPVIGLLGGSKEDPLFIDNGAVQEDNVLAEFNIFPASTEDEWVENILSVMAQLDARLLDKGCTSYIQSSHDFDMGVLKGYGYKALTAGCDPDYNAWTNQQNPMPQLGTLRTAAGHIHFGLPEGYSKVELVRAVQKHDLYMGVPSVLMDMDFRRRELYGKAGCYRPKPYGGEYRTLSNFWLKNESLIRWAWRNSERALADTSGFIDGRVRACIDNHDVALAQELVDEYNLEVA